MQETKKKKSGIKKVLIIIGVVLLVFLLIFSFMFFKLVGFTKKYVCKSSLGNVTLVYNKNTIVAYVATGKLTYDLDEQKKVAEEIGVDSYMEEFNKWFELNTGGTCK